VDETYELIGVGADYVASRAHSVYTAEVHVRYLRELHVGDPVRVTFQLLDYDAKRLHYFEQLFHAEEGWCPPPRRTCRFTWTSRPGRRRPFRRRSPPGLPR